MKFVSTFAGVAAALIAAAGAAQAADLPARVAPAPYVAPLPVFTWTGAYFGINAGYSFDDETRYRLTGATANDNGVGTTRPGAFKQSDDGFSAGGQLGYNYQFGGAGAGASGSLGAFTGGGLVIGFETDANYIDGGKNNTYHGLSAANLTANSRFRSGIDYLGTVRGRVGFAFNTFLVYGTGGFAYGDTFESARLYTAGNAGQLRYFGSKSGIQTGYAYGGGVEYAIPTTSFLNFFHSSAVTVKVEYLRYDLGDQNFAAAYRLPTTAVGQAYNIRTSTDGNLVRAGVNYKF